MHLFFRFARPALIGITASALALGGTLAVAQSSASTVIAKRQANYKKMGGALKTLKDELAKSSPSRAVTIKASQTLANTAKLQVGLFPAGSGPEAGVKTDALPNIWTDRGDFNAATNNLISESAKLAAVAKTGTKAEITAQYRETGKSCGACHRQFRKD